MHTVLTRSPIPRTLSTLRALPSIGIYTTSAAAGGNTECVGWGFLSKDGSISSLHVEPAHRGKGLAVRATRALLDRQAETFARKGEPAGDEADAKDGRAWWGAADVEESNTASRRVMQKLGGVPWWGVQWVEIDVAVVLEGLQGME